MAAWEKAPKVEEPAWASAPKIEGDPPEKDVGFLDRLGEVAKNGPAYGLIRDSAAGAIRGAGSIGATLLTPIDMAARAMGVENGWIGRKDRREAMTEGLKGLGANPDSLAFGGGKLATEIAGTAGAGGVLAQGARALGATPAMARALATGGFSTGRNGADLALRTGAGAMTGGAMAGLVNPSDALTGAMIGGVAPGLTLGAGRAGAWLGDKIASGAEDVMQSALKPTLKARQSGDAAVAVRELLDRGISPTKGGVEKLQALVDATDDRLGQAIANSPARISRDKAMAPLVDVRRQFGSQVSPTSDLAAIDSVAQDFMATNPRATIAVQDAQALKRGTYQVLKKKYGQLGSADVEAQKAIARGIKDEIARAVPEVGPINDELSRLMKTLNVTERRVLLEGNKNPMGLAALVVDHPRAFATFMADRSSQVKGLVARGMNQTGNFGQSASGGLLEAGANPLLRAGLLGVTQGTQR